MGRDMAGVPVIRTARLALLTSGATACSSSPEMCDW
jgi:hypothetical protein